jgi:two-component sensor histidine kinase
MKIKFFLIPVKLYVYYIKSTKNYIIKFKGLLINNITKILLLNILFIFNIAFASGVEMSYIYVDKTSLPLKTIDQKHLFKSYQKSYINLGLTHNSVYIKFKIDKNTKDKVLVLANSRLEQIELFDYKYRSLDKKGYLVFKQNTIYPYFEIDKYKTNNQTFYLKIKNSYSSINFPLKLEDKNIFFQKDANLKFIITALMAMIFSFLLYGVMLYIYTKKTSYFFYAIYLTVFLVYQNWYLGYSKLGLSQEQYAIYSNFSVSLIGLLIITFAFFAMNFMKTHRFKKVHFIYKAFIVIATLEIVIFSFIDFYNIAFMVVTGALFIIYSLLISIYLYLRGIKDIRYFAFGYILGSIGYLVIILDELGVTTLTYNMPYAVLLGTTLEALIFLLAFYDSFNKLSEENSKQKLINHELKLQQVYLNDMHHRVKNNLSLINAMIELNFSTVEEKERINNLKNRIYAISNIYTLLDNTKDKEIKMHTYVNLLAKNIKISYGQKDININIDIDKNLVCTDFYATYLGIIINEIFTNSFKYAFSTNKGEIYLKLKKEQEYCELTIKDSGKGFNAKEIERTYGLKLIKSIIKANLKGEYKIFTINQMKYIIRFKYVNTNS